MHVQMHVQMHVPWGRLGSYVGAFKTTKEYRGFKTNKTNKEYPEYHTK